MCSLRSSASPGSAWTGSRSSTPRTPSSRRVSSRAVARSWACCGPGRRTSTGQTTCFSAASARSPSTAASPRWARSRRFRRCMDAFQAIVLGIVQGLTEFLPISSSGHLRIVPAFFGWEDPGAAFTAVIQLGTMAAVLLYFRADLWRIAVAWLRSLRDPSVRGEIDARMGWYIILGTIPIGVLGLAFQDPIETEFRTLALVPGVSRSGATISAGLLLNFDRAAAARYSFLLSVPAVVLSGVFELRHAGEGNLPIGATIIATVLAFVSCYASIAFLLRYLERHSIGVFVGYRIALGALVIALAAAGAIS